jgi:hypothetical protein
MSHLSKNIPGATGDMSGAEARARAAMVEMEKREPDASKNIRAIGKDPGDIPESVKSLETSDLYAPGKRSERRQILLRHAVEYLFDVPIERGGDQDRLIARIGARTKLMIDWMIGSWENHLRPKTWMDGLKPEQQEKWTMAKRRYDKMVDLENQRLARARAEYDGIVRDVQLKQATAREELRQVLRDFGLSEAPLLAVPTEDRGLEKLQEELKYLGVNFRPPDDRFL